MSVLETRYARPIDLISGMTMSLRRAAVADTGSLYRSDGRKHQARLDGTCSDECDGGFLERKECHSTCRPMEGFVSAGASAVHELPTLSDRAFQVGYITDMGWH